MRLPDSGIPWRRFAAFAASCLALGACDRSANEYAPPPPPSVVVANPVIEDVVETLEFPARVAAQATVEVRARVSGFLEEIAFEEGGVAEEGAVLFRIEQGPYIAQRDLAAATVERMKAQLDLAETRLARAQQAFERDAVSQIEIIQTRAERDQAAAELAAAKAQLDAAEIELSYTTIRAPMEGRTSRARVDKGNLVGANESTLLTTLVDDDIVEVNFDVDERELIRLIELRGGRRSNPADREEQTAARIALADGSEYPQEGYLDFGDNRIDPQTGTLRARAIFENPDGLLVDGMFCRVFVPIRSRKALTIPEAAVSRDASGSFVLVVGADNVVERRKVALGQRTGERLVVLEGLQAEERIIVAGVQRARDGLAVEPREAAEAASGEAGS